MPGRLTGSVGSGSIGAVVLKLAFALSLIGLLAGQFNRFLPALDIAAQLTLHLAFAAMASGVAYLSRRGIMTAAMLMAAMVTAYGLWPRLDAAQRSADLRVSGSIRVGTFSTLGTNKDIAAIHAKIQRLNPDILTLLEVWSDKRPLPDLLRARYPYIHSREAVPSCHLAIISKYPFVTAWHRGNWEGPPQVEAVFGPELGALAVVGVHLSRFPDQALQQSQTASLIEGLKARKGALVLTGDFNATAYSIVPGRIERIAGLRRQTYLPSWPAGFGLPQFALDHIFLSPEIRAAGTALTGRFAGSDHLPVVMDIFLPSP